MKEIKKEIIKKEYLYEYESFDGQLFNTKEECEKYESSAKGVILQKIHNCIVGEKHDAWELMGGYDDHKVVAVKVNTQEDADNLLQFYYLEHPWILENKDINECADNQVKRIQRMLDRALKEKDCILMGIDCDDEYYFINTRNAIIVNLTNVDMQPKK